MISVVCGNVPLYFYFLTWPSVAPKGDYVFKFEDRIGNGMSEGSYFEIFVAGDSIAKVEGRFVLFRSCTNLSGYKYSDRYDSSSDSSHVGT
jgi:hypothetical protein